MNTVEHLAAEQSFFLTSRVGGNQTLSKNSAANAKTSKQLKMSMLTTYELLMLFSCCCRIVCGFTELFVLTVLFYLHGSGHCFHLCKCKQVIKESGIHPNQSEDNPRQSVVSDRDKWNKAEVRRKQIRINDESHGRWYHVCISYRVFFI